MSVGVGVCLTVQVSTILDDRLGLNPEIVNRHAPKPTLSLPSLRPTTAGLCSIFVDAQDGRAEISRCRCNGCVVLEFKL